MSIVANLTCLNQFDINDFSNNIAHAVPNMRLLFKITVKKRGMFLKESTGRNIDPIPINKEILTIFKNFSVTFISLNILKARPIMLTNTGNVAAYPTALGIE